MKQVIPGRCEEDKEMKDKMERAVPDCVLKCGDVHYFVEVKSYPFAELDDKRFCTEGYKRPYLRDLEQALEYARRGSEQGKKRALLVYRGLPFEGLRDAVVVFEFDATEELRPSEAYSASDLSQLRYKPGPECLACEQEKCPIRNPMRKYLQDSGCSSASAPSSGCTGQQRPKDEIEAYQRLLLAEWCLARHGTRCVKCGPMHFALSQNTYHRSDLPLTEEHAKYVVQDSAILAKLISEGVLIESDCSAYTNALSKLIQALNRTEAENGLIWVDNVTRSDFIILLEYLSLLYNTDNRVEKKIKLPERCFRTFHGKVAQLLRHTAALPGDIRTFEGFYLPAIIDYLGEEVDLDKVAAKVANAVEEIAKKLGAKADSHLIRKAVEGLSDEKGQQIKKLRPFQLRALEEASQKIGGSGPPLILLTAPPGAGKTLVFLIMALAVALSGGKVLIMYPTKKLAVQQVQQLYYTLERLNATLGNKLTLAIADGDSRECREGSARALKCRGGQGSLHFDGRKYVCKDGSNEIEVEWFCECEECDPLSSRIIVTNPFKLSSILRRESPDEVKEFARDIRLIIIDEAHTLLEAKKLDFMTALLHRLILLGGLESNMPAIILSSATITSSGLPLAESYGEEVTLRSIGALERVEGSSTARSFLTALAEQLLGRGLAQKYQLVAVDYYEVPESSGRMKITAPMIVFTSPDESTAGTVQEATVTLALAAGARMGAGGRRLMRSFSSIIFFDNKEELHEVERYVRCRLLAVEGSPADKTLTKPLALKNLQQQLGGRPQGGRSASGECSIDTTKPWGSRGLEVVKTLLTRAVQQHGDNDELQIYSHLPLFCTNSADMKSALKYAYMIYSNQQAGTAPKCYDISARVAAEITYDTLSHGHDVAQRSYILIHHADLRREMRYNIEKRLEEPGKWAVVLATSTLEVGVNLRGVGVVAQHGLPRLASSVVQRFGRGGRDGDVFFTSFGVLFPRHTGEDIALLDEDYAVSRMFAFKAPEMPPRDKGRILSVEQLIAYTLQSRSNYKEVLAKSVEYLVGDKEAGDFLSEVYNRAEEIYDFIEMARESLQYNKSGNKLLNDAVDEVVGEILEHEQKLEEKSNELEEIKKDLIELSVNNDYLYKLISDISSYIKNILEKSKDKDSILYNRLALIVTTKKLQELGKRLANELSKVGGKLKYAYNVPDYVSGIANSLHQKLFETLTLEYRREGGLDAEVRWLSTVLIPPLIHPYIINIQSHRIYVERRSKNVTRRSVDIDEVFIKGRPLLTDRYGGLW
ncbi:MAG: DEAD/DEAH box helicase [Pyrobaculum sp.]